MIFPDGSASSTATCSWELFTESSKRVQQSPRQLSESPVTSERSASSTVIYDQEPFTEFSKRVPQLCHSIWPSIPTSQIQIHRLAGGGFNRIIGLTVEHQQLQSEALILRVPRFDDADVQCELAVLRLVLSSNPSSNSLPVPRVITFDSTNDNALNQPYTIQRQIQGSSILGVYTTLSHDLCCSFVRQYAKALLAIQAITSPSAGAILAQAPSPRSAYSGTLPGALLDTELLPVPMVGPYNLIPVDGTKVIDEPASSLPESDLQVLFLQFDRWSQANPSVAHLLQQMKPVAQQMRLDFPRLFDQQFTLHHPDLEPRNILVDLNNGQLKITGILDWDNSIFAPKIMSCVPPMWIWAWKDDEEDDEHLANDPPESEEMRELKQLFEDLVGTEYTDLAYGTECRLARKLWNFGINGIHTNEHFREAERLPREWAEYRQTCSAKDK